MTGALQIREAQKSDRPEILKVVEAAFGQPDEARLVEALWDAAAMTLEVVALRGGELIGYCAFSPVTVEPPLEGPAFGLVPAAVAPADQRRGIGAATIRSGIELARARGASLIVVVGEPDYYSRFGFAPAAPRNIRWAAMDAGDAFQVIDFTGSPANIARLVHYHPVIEAA